MTSWPLYVFFKGSYSLLELVAMAIQGMELFAVAVVILLFIMVLKQFGMTEAQSLDGKNHRMVLMLALVYCKKCQLFQYADLLLFS